MPLSLITGPPNSGRAAEIRGQLAEALQAEPVLVVPNSDDVNRFERELTQLSPSPQAVIGASVRTFEGFFGDVADAVGSRALAPLTVAQRRRAIALAARDCGDARMRLLSSRPGFLEALAETIKELQEGRVAPEGVERAAAEHEDGSHLRGLAAAYRGYLELRDRLGRADRHLVAEQAISGVRTAPDVWGGRPVFVYGFDDLSELQFAMVEALADATRVTVALTFEEAREVSGPRATLHERLREIATQSMALPPNPEHTPSPALSALERGLFEDAPDRAEPDDGLVLMESAGELAEAEAIGAEIAALVAAGTRPDEIAIALRTVERLGPLYAGVLERLGVEAAVHADVPLAATGAGAGLIALVRAAERGEAGDLVAYLRAPGRAYPDQVDWLERNLRRERVRDLDEALESWNADRSTRELAELAELRAADSPAEACRVLADVARRMTGGTHRRDAPRLAGPEQLEARAAQLAARTAEELAELDGLAPGLAELRTALEALEVPLASGDPEGRVQVTTPFRLRAGHLSHVFVASLQEGEFPAAAPRPGVLADDERAGVGLADRADPEAEERYLFYVCASWPTDRLYLSWRIAAEDGSAESPSPFVEEVRETLAPPPPRAGGPDPVLAELTRVRGPGGVVLAPEEAPSPRELARAIAARGRDADHAAALAALGVDGAPAAEIAQELEATARRFELPQDVTHPLVLASLTDRPPLGASTLETYAVCSYRWFVDHELDPQTLEPKPEPMSQGTVVHATLERLYADPPGEEGVPRPTTLAAWQARAAALLAEIAESEGLGPHDAVRRAGLERMRTLLAGFLAREASRDWSLRPDAKLLEAKFGDDAEVGALDLGGFQMRGSIDRVDVATAADGTRVGLVRDYKLSRKVATPRNFQEEGRLQLQLYMLALRRLFGVEPIGGIYEPLGGEVKDKPRGPILDEATGELLDAGSVVSTDVVDRDAFERTLEAARETATDVVTRMRDGQVTRNPLGGVCPRWCTFQPICRRERAPLAAREDTKSDGNREDAEG
jgi:hypothetical protein